MTGGDGLKFLMALLYAPGPKGQVADPIRGTTRLEKLAFLAQREYGLPNRYSFEPYDYGPWSAEVVDDADALRAVGLMEVIEEPLALSYQEGDDIVTESQIPDRDDPESLQPGKLRRYKLTAAGQTAAKKLWSILPAPERNQISALKQAYNQIPLTDLLRHVYTKYPETASRSKIAAALTKRGSRPWLKAQRLD